MKNILRIGMCFLLFVSLTGCTRAELSKEGITKDESLVTTESIDDDIDDKKEAVDKSDEEATDEDIVSESDYVETAKRIVCWGDSLTFGQGGNGVTYPLVLEEKTGLEVVNYGIQGETARQIAIRMGVLPMTTGAFDLPADTAPVEVTLWQGGEDPIMMRLGDCAINPCVIDGVEGILSYKVEDNKYYFTRSEAGEAKQVEADTLVETYASRDIDSSDIIVLFAGTNLPPSKETVGELIDMEKKMLEYLGSEKYVVIGLTSKILIPDIEPINEALSEAFGENFLDIREYLLTDALNDAGIEPTKKDKKNIANGKVPKSLRVDEVHGTDVFYRLIGEQVYEKIVELGYIE